MLSKTDLKEQKGLSKILIIVIALVALLIIVGVILLIVLNQNKQQPIIEDEPEETQDIIETSTEITIEEKNKIKNEYLGRFSILLSDAYNTGNESLIEIASQFIKNNSTSTGLNTVSSNQPNETNNNLIGSTENVIETSNTVDSIGTTIGSGLYNSNSTLDATEVKKAIDEIRGINIENLNDLLSNWNDSKVVNAGYVTDIVSISKQNGIYDIIYNVCWPSSAELTKYSAFDKIDTSKIDKLESTQIKIQLSKNSNYKYSEYKIVSIEEVYKEIPTAYYLTYDNNKFGVMDQTGRVVIPNSYDWIDIPNTYKDVFVCKIGTGTIVLNKNGDELYKDYQNISVIESTAGGNTKWYERDFLVYEKNGLFGAIDYDGFEIFKPIYTSIEPLYYIKGAIILTNDLGSKTLAYINGETHNFKYSKVGLLGGQFPLESMVNSQRTIEQVQQIIQTNMYILGEDINAITEQIKTISVEDYNKDYNNEIQVSYEPKIGQWELRNIEGGSVGRIAGTYYYVYIKTEAPNQTPTETTQTSNTINE